MCILTAGGDVCVVGNKRAKVLNFFLFKPVCIEKKQYCRSRQELAKRNIPHQNSIDHSCKFLLQKLKKNLCSLERSRNSISQILEVDFSNCTYFLCELPLNIHLMLESIVCKPLFLPMHVYEVLTIYTFQNCTSTNTPHCSAKFFSFT